MDDLEDSITAAILTKHPVVNENLNPPQQFHTPPPTMRQNLPTSSMPQQQINYAPQQNYQQQVTFEQSHLQQQQTLTQLLMEPDSLDEERQVLTLSNGQRITLAEYKRMQQQQPRTPGQMQQQPRYIYISYF